MAPVDAFKQHGELYHGQVHGAFGRLWPEEATVLQTFGEETKAITIPPESSLMRSPRRPRKTKTWSPKGSAPSFSWTIAAIPSNPRRMSVIPPASQMRVPLGKPIIADAV